MPPSSVSDTSPPSGSGSGSAGSTAVMAAARLYRFLVLFLCFVLRLLMVGELRAFCLPQPENFG